MTRNSSPIALAIAASLSLSAGVQAQTLNLLPTTTPAAASPGGANVFITASGLPTPAPTAAQIQVTFTPAVSSSGPVVTTTATALETVYETQSRIAFRVPPSLTFAAPVAYNVTLAGPGLTSANSAQFTVNPPAFVQTLNPAYGLPGQTVSVAITGAFSDFTPSVTQANFGTGVTVTSLTVTGPTAATAQLQIDAMAALGTNNVTLQTGVENAVLAGGFAIAGPPSISTVTPATGAQGTTFSFNVTGVNTHFSNASVLAFAGTGITLNGISVNSPTSLSANVTIAANAPVGSQSFTITSGTETVTSALTVTPPLPMVTMANPAIGAQGTTLTVTLTGQFTHFAAGSTVTFSASGVTAGAPSVTSATSLSVPVTIASNATLGAGNITVTTGTEIATGSGVFTVVPLTAPVSGIVTQSDGLTPVAGALVRLYQGATPLLATPQITANGAGAYSFPAVTGAFTVIALNPAQTQIGTVSSQVQSLAGTTANVSLGGTGQVTVDIFDSNGTPVPNANVTMSLTGFPADLAAILTASTTATSAGVATFPAFFAGSLFVSAGDPATNHGGTTTGSVTSGGSVTIPLYFNVNEVTANIFSVQNGVVPGTVGAPGTNETPFWIFSVQNGTIPGTTGATGTNEAPFWIFSVQNGTIPGTTGATGTNEAPFWIFSVLNGTVPGSTISMGMNETVFPIFSVGNSTSNPMAITSALKPASVSAANAVTKPHVTLASDRVTAGQTIHIAAALDNASAATTTEFFINGESFGVYAAPFGFDLTVPYTQPQLSVKAIAGGNSDEAAIIVTPEATRALRGRIVGGDLAPARDKTVTLNYSGLRAELFHFPAPLTSMPDLTNLTPVATRAVSALDLRNPNGVFGKDPLATGLAPDYAIRFRASLDVAEEGDYVFSLRGHEGAALRVGGQPVTDGGKVHLEKGSAPVEAIVFVGAGAMELQLLWQPPGQVMQPVAEGLLWVRDSGLSATTDLSGQFEFAAVPASLGTVKVVGEGVASEPIPAAAGDAGVLTVRKTVQ